MTDFYRPKEVPLGGFRQVARKVDKPSRRVSPVRTRSIWTLKPDTWVERMDAYLWRHPWQQSIAGSIVVFLLVGSLIYLVVKAARMGP